MKRLTTDAPDGNFETALNFVYGKNGWAYIRHDGEHEDVMLTDWAKRQCKLRGCDEVLTETPEEIDERLCDCMMDGPICPIALAYCFASQAVHMRSRLKKYEDVFFTEDGTERITLKDLQAMAALPSNEPLTLEELREMDGEPVWVEFPKCPEASGWMLISASRHCVYNGLLGDCDFENCGRNWLACRRRPEALGGEAAPTLSRPKVGPREGKA